MPNNETLAAFLLTAASIIHNYSFMCRKLPATEVKVFYPRNPIGKAMFDMSWTLMAAGGLILAFTRSWSLTLIAAAIYFLLLPFVLQPPLARLLGFCSLTGYLEQVDKVKKTSS